MRLVKGISLMVLAVCVGGCSEVPLEHANSITQPTTEESTQREDAPSHTVAAQEIEEVVAPVIETLEEVPVEVEVTGVAEEEIEEPPVVIEILPWSSVTKIGERELDDFSFTLDKSILKQAQEEIYVRHGLTMPTDFEQLNAIEQYNIKLLDFLYSKEWNGEAAWDLNYFTTDKYTSNYMAFLLDEPIVMDLDGDGTLEYVRYSYQMDEEALSLVTLEINEAIQMVVPLVYAMDYFAVVDLDEADNYKELVISDYGPSDDYVSYIYRYAEGALHEVGVVEGLFSLGLGIDGAGRVLARTRLNLLQTWYMDKPYNLQDGQLIPEEGIYTTYHRVFLKEMLPVYEAPDANSPSFTIPEGTLATLIATDDVMWCCIETEEGEKGWFRVDNFDTLTDLALTGMEVFVGLAYYD